MSNGFDGFIDTDAGVDDAVALLAALKHPGLSWSAISAVAGNVDVDQVTANVGYLLDATQKNIPLYRGAEKAFFQLPQRSTEFMGPDGLGGATASLPALQHRAQPTPAVLALPGLIRAAAQRGAVTFVALGPLTNLALAVRLDPELPNLITRLVVMGGAVHGQGNSTPMAEFNFFADPEAAAIVFGAGFAETWLLPWETCLRYTLLWDEYARFCDLGTPHAELFRNITAFLAERGRLQAGLPGLPLPDLLAMAVAVHPAAATRIEQVYLQVDARPGPGYGQSIVDWFGLMGKHANVHIIEEVDQDFVFSFLRTALID